MTGRHKWSDIRHKSTPEQMEKARADLALSLVQYWAGEYRREAQQMMLADERIAPDVVARYFEEIEDIASEALGEES